MTLLIRLSIILLLTAIATVAGIIYIHPHKAPFVGEYRANNQKGDYVLKLLNAQTAVIIFTDKAQQRLAYRGDIQLNQRSLLIRWKERRNGDSWDALPAPVSVAMEFTSPAQISSPEGLFERVPPKFWERWLN